MGASGLPNPRDDHAQAAARLALAMREVVAEPMYQTLELRIGLGSGPAVAGVLGTRRFAYDLWGDAVNTASRMESHGLPGEIQVDEATRTLLGDAFELEERGEIEVKGKGSMMTWVLKG